ncbi:Uncharacterised protein [Vibrio cholerae]|nr:Uncharacterised protein [Vibrio cholerae]CSI62106.1 Uncharacterised protein [Vibrio cholerae]
MPYADENDCFLWYKYPRHLGHDAARPSKRHKLTGLQALYPRFQQYHTCPNPRFQPSPALNRAREKT